MVNTDGAVTFVALYCESLDLSLSFYHCLGYRFTEEQHGRGPVHYSATLDGGIVLELYPQRTSLEATEHKKPSVTLGLRVRSVPDALRHLVNLQHLTQEEAAKLHQEACTVVDPDGLRVRISQP